jgi:multiple sugar transport system permease protein
MLKAQAKYRNAFLLPTIFILLVVGVVPFLYTLRTSFVTWELRKPSLGQPFVGLGNYAEVISDPVFWNSVKLTLIFSVCALSVEMCLGFLIALLASSRQSRLGQSFIIFLLPPSIIAPVIAGFSWLFMYDARLGIVNYLTSLVGIPSQAWLGNKDLALPAIIVTDIWQWTPFVALVLYAGLKGLSQEVVESAMVDGASYVQRIRYIIIPMIKTPILIALLFRGMEVVRWFDTIHIMTDGGPGNATFVLSEFLYKNAFMYFHIGDSAAIAFLMLIMVTFFSKGLINLMAKEPMQ